MRRILLLLLFLGIAAQAFAQQDLKIKVGATSGELTSTTKQNHRQARKRRIRDSLGDAAALFRFDRIENVEGRFYPISQPSMACFQA